MKQITPAQKLATDYLPYARGIARDFCRRLRKPSESDDVFSDACLGLVRASNAYDAARGTPFAVYAASWIFGAIKDGLRSRNKLAIAGIETVSLDAMIDVIGSWAGGRCPLPSSAENEILAALADSNSPDPSEAAEISEVAEGISRNKYERPKKKTFSVSAIAERFSISRGHASERLKMARQILAQITEGNPCLN